MIEAVLMGTGTSTGVPVLGKTYPKSFLDNPKNHRLRCSLLLRSDEGNVVVDAGPDIRQQLLRENVLSINGLFLTHSHADHIMGLDDLRAYCIKSGEAVDIYSSERYHADVKRIFDYAFGEYPAGIWVPRFELKPVQPIHRLAGMEIKTFWVDHGPMPVLGLRVNDFAYLTDVNNIPDDARAMLNGLEVLILDAVRYRPHPNHFHFEKALEVAQEIGAKTTYLTHLADDYDHDLVESELPANIRLAYDGLTFQI